MAQQTWIQELRLVHDRQFERWPPHVNILYPFVPRSSFPAVAAALACALEATPPFETTISALHAFKHKKSVTAWLDPAGKGAAASWEAVHAAVLGAVPHCDANVRRGGFVPHLTVAQPSGAKELAGLEASVGAALRGAAMPPLRVPVAELCLISRAGSESPFLVHWRVRLGCGGARPEDPLCRGAHRPAVAAAAATPCVGGVGLGGWCGCSTHGMSPWCSTRPTPRPVFTPGPTPTRGSVLVTLAMNANRSKRVTVLVSAAAQTSIDAGAKGLRQLAKHKLRLRGGPQDFVFYRTDGALLAEGEALHRDQLVLVSRGEAFVGSTRVAEPAAEPAPTEPATAPGFDRQWAAGGQRWSWRAAALAADTSGCRLRLLSWNILAACLANGSSSTGSVDAGGGLAAAAQVPRPAGVHYRDLMKTDGVLATDTGGDRDVPFYMLAKAKAKAKAAAKQEHHRFACAAQLLAWEHRAPLVAREILAHAPDMLCLQEVDAAQLSWLRLLLTPHGWVGVAANEKMKGGGHCCALFWRKAVLTAVGSPLVCVLDGGAHMLLLQRLQPVAAAAVAAGESGETRSARTNAFVLATTHLKAGVAAGMEARRVQQVRTVLAQLGAFAASAAEPLVLARDRPFPVK
jgi:2'-5' RNA ligase